MQEQANSGWYRSRGSYALLKVFLHGFSLSAHKKEWWKNGGRKQTEESLLYQCRSQFSSVQSLSRVQLFATPWTAVCQASLSIINSRSPPKPKSIVSVIPFNHLILCCPLFLMPSTFHRNRVFSNESALHIRWPKYWSFSFNISPSNEHPGLISLRIAPASHQLSIDGLPLSHQW